MKASIRRQVRGLNSETLVLLYGAVHRLAIGVAPFLIREMGCMWKPVLTRVVKDIPEGDSRAFHILFLCSLEKAGMNLGILILPVIYHYAIFYRLLLISLKSLATTL